MAVSISMSVTENSVDTSNNRSLVTVTVTAHYTGGSFNRNGPQLTVYLDGTPDVVYVDFNANELSSGSETIYSRQWYVSHDSDGTKTLYYNATYVTGVSSGTVTASGSKVLTPISVPGGGSGSGSGDGDGDGGDDGDDSGSGGTSGNESIEGIVCDPDTNVIFYGTRSENRDYSYGNNTLVNYNPSSSINYPYAYIKFKTPSEIKEHDGITVRLYNFSVHLVPYTFNFNVYNDYIYFDLVTEELNPYLAHVVPIEVSEESSFTYPVYNVKLPYSSLEPDTIYYIRMMNRYFDDGSFYADAAPAVIINYTYTGVAHIEDGSEYGEYQLNIDDGTSWNAYAPYIDNGASWGAYG